jgi:HlyD family secretion protein
MRKFRKFIVIVLSLGLVACGGASGGNQTPPPIVVDDLAVIADGRLLPSQFAQLSFSAGGQVAEILAAEGDALADGAVIARLGNRELLEAEVARAQLELLNAQQALAALQDSAAVVAAQAELDVAQARDKLDQAQRRLRGVQNPNVKFYQDRVEDAQQALTTVQQNSEITDIGGLKTGVTAAQDALETATNNLNDLQSLNERYDGCCTQRIEDAQEAYAQAADNVRVAELRLEQAQSANAQSLEDTQKALDDAQKDLAYIQGSPNTIKLSLAQADVKLAEANLAEAQARAAKVKGGPDPDQLALAQARLVSAQDGLAAAEAGLKNSELRAPFAGVIAKLNLKVGERVTTGQAVATLADFSSWVVETDNLTEIEVVKIKTGQGASIVLDALPGQSLSGKVTSISSVFEEKRGDITYTVKLALENKLPEMRWGMTAEVTFDK